jgi:hypothetical protein
VFADLFYSMTASVHGNVHNLFLPMVRHNNLFSKWVPSLVRAEPLRGVKIKRISAGTFVCMLWCIRVCVYNMWMYARVDVSSRNM